MFRATDDLPMATLMTMENDTQSPTLQAGSEFLSAYSERLFSSGSTCIRLEKNVGRIARAWGMDVDISILPHHLHITVHDAGRTDAVTTVTTIQPRAVSFATITCLSSLSWDIADGHVDFGEALSRFNALPDTVGEIGPWQELLLVSVANASFCRLFGGDMIAMVIVFLATMAGYALKQTMLERGCDIRVTFIACSFISAVLASADSLFSLGTTPVIAVGTSVLYLVPGIPFLNSLSDMIDGHYICAFGRLMHALVLTACLSVGLLAGMIAMNINMF